MRVAIFARPPIPGRCKTRLAAAIGDQRAADLSAAFVADTVAACRGIAGLAPELHVTDTIDHPLFVSLALRFELPPPIAQARGGLGARMQHALDRGPGDAAIVVGTDAPTLPRSIVVRTIDLLDRADVVLAPAADGGYVLIASAGRASTQFLGDPAMRWSSPHTLADTLRGARGAGLRPALTAPHYDVDELADLQLLSTELTLEPRAAPATALVLSRIRDETLDHTRRGRDF